MVLETVHQLELSGQLVSLTVLIRFVRAIDLEYFKLVIVSVRTLDVADFLLIGIIRTIDRGDY